MTTPDILVEHLQALDAPQAQYCELQRYFDGYSRLSFLSAEQKIALKNFDRVSSNVCRAAILALQERLCVSGLGDAFPLWLANNMDQRAIQVHQDALLFGFGAVGVWTDRRGRPTATVESPKTFVVQRDPITRELVSACKRVRTKTTTEAWIYLPDKITHYRADTPGAATAGFNVVDEMDNPLGTPPVAVIGHECQPSASADLLTLQNALDKTLLDGLTASEAAAFPRRFAAGLAPEERQKLDDEGNPVLDEDNQPVMQLVNPLAEDRMKVWLSDDPETKFGQLAATDLAAFEALTRVILAQCMMVSGLPAHYLGQLTAAAQPTSADALRASEAALVARVESYQLQYGTGWERVGQLLLAVRDGGDPDDIPVSVQWRPADTRSEAQLSDSVTKLVAQRILPVSYALKKLGYDDEEIAAIMAAREQEIASGISADIERFTNAIAARG
ncbi:phage portal protein [Mycobacterium riyadhense]|uniref:phage portal protein n=1 Tax=Mycobacterium riyadhense TaxID=486698 RepID=UPI0019503723|nr:phage portal protein [Mycobacterium riyadhense]